MTQDVFDATLLCKACKQEMQPSEVHREGFTLRAVECPHCHEKIVHPIDQHALEQYHGLKGKTFVVKLRMVGNSHAISIPKEIVEFMEEQQRLARKRMDAMVRLCFEDFHKLSVRFGP